MTMNQPELSGNGTGAGFPALAISYVAISTLRQRTRQLRKHSKSKIERLGQFIVQSRFVMPLVIDAQNNVLLGNARLLAMIELGLTSVPVIRITHLDETMMRALIIADNQFCLNAEWYKKELRAELAELQPLLAELGLQLMDLGFEAAEIDIHLGDIGLPGQTDNAVASH